MWHTEPKHTILRSSHHQVREISHSKTGKEHGMQKSRSHFFEIFTKIILQIKNIFLCLLRMLVHELLEEGALACSRGTRHYNRAKHVDSSDLFCFLLSLFVDLDSGCWCDCGGLRVLFLVPLLHVNDLNSSTSGATIKEGLREGYREEMSWEINKTEERRANKTGWRNGAWGGFASQPTKSRP